MRRQTMARRRPQMTHHKPTGQARVRLNGKDHYLGRWGTPKCHARFAELMEAWEANGHEPLQRLVDVEQRARLVVSTAADDYCGWIRDEGLYLKNGKPTSTRDQVRKALDEFCEYAGNTRIDKLEGAQLARFRESLAAAGRLSRQGVVRKMSILRRFFEWARDMELLPDAVFLSLQSVSGGPRTLRNLRPKRQVEVVEWERVEKVLHRLNRFLRAMVLLQWYTGMRPGEVCTMRPRDISRCGEVWEYMPHTHKNEHRALSRVVPLGPKAQEILEPFLDCVPRPSPDDFLFSAQSAEAERNKRRREERRTLRWPSHEAYQLRKRERAETRRQQRRAEGKPDGTVGGTYTTSSYRKALRRACNEAGVRVWSPNQLRHAAATRLRREHGIEIARVILGHTSIATTELYAERDLETAREVMSRCG